MVLIQAAIAGTATTTGTHSLETIKQVKQMPCQGVISLAEDVNCIYYFFLWNYSYTMCSSSTKQILLFMLFRFFLLIWQAIHHGPKALGAALNKDKNRGNGVQWDPNRKSWHCIYIALFRFCLFSIKLAILDVGLNQGYSFVSECKLIILICVQFIYENGRKACWSNYGDNRP